MFMRFEFLETNQKNHTKFSRWSANLFFFSGCNPQSLEIKKWKRFRCLYVSFLKLCFVHKTFYVTNTFHLHTGFFAAVLYWVHSSAKLYQPKKLDRVANIRLPFQLLGVLSVYVALHNLTYLCKVQKILMCGIEMIPNLLKKTWLRPCNVMIATQLNDSAISDFNFF